MDRPAESVAAGYENEEWISRDSDLDTLREMPEFHALLEGLAARNRIRP